MDNSKHFAARFCGAAGNLLYVSGLYHWAASDPGEVQLLVTLAIMAAAFGLLLFHAETTVLAAARPRAWALIGLMGPLGWGLLYVMGRHARENNVSRRVNPAAAVTSGHGVAAFLILVLCWAAAVFCLFTDLSFKPKNWAGQKADNERAGYHNIRSIAQAQRQYRMTDWNNDGHTAFAQFLPHLWTTLDQRTMPVKTGLLPKKLAFAIRPENAVRGYFFVNRVGTRQPAPPASQTGTDPAALYAADAGFQVFGFPSFHGETGPLVFKSDPSGRVFAGTVSAQLLPSDIMTNPRNGSWVEIRDESDLSAIQHKLIEQDEN